MAIQRNEYITEEMSQPRTGLGITQAQCVPDAPKQKKHEELQAAINELNYVKDRLYALAERIRGAGVADKNESHDPPMPPLAHFLDCGKDYVRDLDRDMHEAISDIEDMLF